MKGAAALLASLALAACTQAADRAPPRRPSIVSLNPCSDAVLAEVADPAQILALSDYSRHPASSSMDIAVARRFRAVSGSAEEILALRPDVVIAGSFLAPALVEALRAQRIALVEIPVATSIAESEAQVREIAQIAGQRGNGEALVAWIEASLSVAAPAPGVRPLSAVVWQSGGIVPGEATLIADLLRRTGFANFSAARGFRQADVLPLEQMVADPPRVIFVAGNPRAQEDRLLAHPALAALTGTRRANLDPSLLWCGGPTIPRVAARLAQVRRTLGEGGARGWPSAAFGSTGSARAGVVESGNQVENQTPPSLDLSKHVLSSAEGAARDAGAIR